MSEMQIKPSALAGPRWEIQQPEALSDDRAHRWARLTSFTPAELRASDPGFRHWWQARSRVLTLTVAVSNIALIGGIVASSPSVRADREQVR